MEFGKAEIIELEEIDYTLPSDPQSTTTFLSDNKGRFNTKVFVGCSKWGQKEWVGNVYPEGTSEEDFLKLYCEKFDCIELDTTFYNMQRKNVTKVIEAVKGKNFKVCPKFNRRISHCKSFEEVTDITTYFTGLMNQFGENLGACILQLPEYFAQKRMDDLKCLFDNLPEKFPINVELRNKGWFYDSEHPVFYMMKERNVGVAITATAGRRDVIHMHITNPTIIIRYLGNNLHSTDYLRMDLWSERIKSWYDQKALKEIYFFVHHDDEKHSPNTVFYMAKKLKELGVETKAPEMA